MLPGIIIRLARPADVPGIITLFTAVAEERDSIGTEPGFDVAQRQSSILTSIEEGASCVPVEGRLRRHFRRANGELWDVVTMGLVLDTQSPGSSYPDAENL
jgi:hypothetical protein